MFDKRIFVFLAILLPSLLSAQSYSSRATPSGREFTVNYDSQTLDKLLKGEPPSGFVPYGKPGTPAIYGQVFRVPIPAGAVVSSKILNIKTTPLSRSIGRFQSDAPAVIIRGPYPTSAIDISSQRMYRDVSYVDVLVFPIQVNGTKAEFHPSIQFAVNFGGSGGLRTQNRVFHNERLFAAPIESAGPQAERGLRSQPLVASWQPPVHTDQVYKIKVRKDRIYKLDYSFISANTTWPVNSLDPRKFRLFDKGTEIPIYVNGEQDGIFGSGDAVYFYGRAVSGENDTGVWEKGDFTDDNVYWLMIGTQNGLRMNTRNVNPVSGYPVPANFTSTVHFEQNPFFFQFNSQPDNDLWLWLNAYWIGGDSTHAAQDHNVTLPSIASVPGSASLKFAARGRSYADINPDHHFSVKVNTHLLGNMTSDAYDPAEATFTFNQNFLNGPGTKTIKVTHTISNPSNFGLGSDYVQSDWFDVTYARQFEAYNNELSFHSGAGNFQFQIPNFSSAEIAAFDVNSPDAPVRLINASITTTSTSKITFQDSLASSSDYAVTVPVPPAAVDFVPDTPSSLSNIDPATNWILIAPQAWTSSSAVQDLKALRQSQGLTAAVVSVEDVYDEFNFGILSPYAIKNFLQYVYNLSSPAQLEYVALVGDAEYDYKDYAADGDFDFVPTMMVADPGLGSAFFPYPIHSFDNYYGCFTGNDSVPEIEIGRIPARNLTEATDALTKIKYYETGIVDHSWLGKTLFAADCQDAFEFESEQEGNVPYVRPQPPHSVTKMYFAQAPWNCATNDSNGNSVADLVEQMNSGQAIVSYLGHGSFTQLSSLNVLQNSDFPNLTNSAKPSVVLNADCFTGAFYHSAIPTTLLEGLMARQTGMVSGIGPGTFMFGFQQNMILGTFLSDAFGKDKVRVLGDLYQHIVMDLVSSGDTRLGEGMAEFGDPASRLAMPTPAAPQNLHADPTSCGTINLAWDAPGGFSGTYNVMRATSATGPFTQVNSAAVSQLTYSDSPPTNATYYYYVAAVDGEGFEGIGSNVIAATPAPPPTAANSGPVCQGSTLNLTASTIPGATYHWTGPNGFTSNDQNPSITGISIAGAGAYTVTATINGCTSAGSTTSVIVSTGLPASPGNSLQLFNLGGDVWLFWSPAAGALSYSIRRCDSSSGACTPAQLVDVQETDWIDSGVPANTWYSIVSVNGCGVSP